MLISKVPPNLVTGEYESVQIRIISFLPIPILWTHVANLDDVIETFIWISGIGYFPPLTIVET